MSFWQVGVEEWAFLPTGLPIPSGRLVPNRQPAGNASAVSGATRHSTADGSAGSRLPGRFRCSRL